ncbi:MULTISPECIES: acyltransferase family protein [Sphingomonas]|uniref:Surface polysaccharide O-acyltransferase-like enzyme n=2 Tax=Sphingomonas TaxID=13687 RepID=A0A7X5XZJ1_9SPHN|nr:MULTISPECIES: acyltransferase family protein [Sphingomonas]NJB98287.1 surface polysaccharide O-acyltransferase-like enzyme [Sphingomonas trueperi]RSV45474.1 acyltransferase [Sphingomonas sp. ABOLE]
MASPHPTPTQRNAGIDLVRVLMTMLVILHHTAIVYGGSGGWFWRQEPNASNPLLVMFNAVNQSYFMGLFFLLAGYYTPASFGRKGAGRYLADRGIRLGLPLLAFFFVLFPLTVAIADAVSGEDLLRRWGRGIMGGTHGPGPLWFALALLIFAHAYALLRWAGAFPASGRAAAALPRPGTLLLAMLGIGLVAFAVRLVIPVGHEVLWLQLGYFPGYILLFLAGIAAAPNRLLERIGMRAALPWLAVAVLAIVTLPVVIALHGAAGGFEGGWNWNALYYALWEPFVATGVILTLFAWAAAPARRSGPVARWFAANAFGAFIVHPPVVGALSRWAATIPAAPWIKFIGVSAAACICAFALASALRAIPGVRRVL